MWRQRLAPLCSAAFRWFCHPVLLSHSGTHFLRLPSTRYSYTTHWHVDVCAHVTTLPRSPGTCGLWPLILVRSYLSATHSLHSHWPAFLHSFILCVLGRFRLRAWVLVTTQRASSTRVGQGPRLTQPDIWPNWVKSFVYLRELSRLSLTDVRWGLIAIWRYFAGDISSEHLNLQWL